MNSNLKEANKKLKELKEALSVVQKIEDQISWACDFTSYTIISNALEPVYEVVDSAKENIENEIFYLEDQLEEYNFKLAEFEEENKIDVYAQA